MSMGKGMVAAAMMAGLSLAAGAQDKAAGIEPPVTGLLVHYQYWPEQFVQWTGPELPYSMMLLQVNPNAGRPIYDVVLTERASQKRVHYSNVKAVAEAAKKIDGEGYETKIEFSRPEAATVGSVYTLKFTMQDGRAVEWRFVQGSEISEQGSGLTALPEAKVPVLVYREQGAVAGDGTALQIGDKVSVAEVWKEISQPPYFVAYRGALTQGSTTVTLAGGDEKWTVADAPAALSVGAEWKLAAEDGRTSTLKIEKAAGDHYTLVRTDGSGNLRQTLEATHGASGWAIERVQYRPGDLGEAHAFSLVFTPPLSGSGTSNAEFVVGKKTKIATATMVTAGDAGKRSVDLTMKTPDWAKGKELAGVTSQGGGAMEVMIGPK